PYWRGRTACGTHQDPRESLGSKCAPTRRAETCCRISSASCSITSSDCRSLRDASGGNTISRKAICATFFARSSIPSRFNEAGLIVRRYKTGQLVSLVNGGDLPPLTPPAAECDAKQELRLVPVTVQQSAWFGELL